MQVIIKLANWLKRQWFRKVWVKKWQSLAKAETIILKDGQEFSVREVVPGDEKKLLKYRSELSARSKEMFEGHAWDSRAIEEIVAQSVKRLDYRIIVIDKDGQIAGYAFLQDVWASIPILGMGIVDRYHHRGLGKKLLEKLIVFARQTKRKAIGLTVIKENLPALTLYLNYGFIINSELQDQAGKNYYKMCLTLG